MKRTKETFFREHPPPPEREGISGCKEFDGEDLQADARRAFLKQQQKEWLLQQMREKEEKKQREKQEEMSYASQTLELNRMRGMLQDDFQYRKKDIKNNLKDENLQLALEKREREKEAKEIKKTEELAEVHELQERGQKRPFP